MIFGSRCIVEEPITSTVKGSSRIQVGGDDQDPRYPQGVKKKDLDNADVCVLYLSPLF